MFKEGVQDQLSKLDNNIVGLYATKKHVKEITALLILNKTRCKLGFKMLVPLPHMSFTGTPGKGKITVAVGMGQVLAKLGYA